MTGRALGGRVRGLLLFSRSGFTRELTAEAAAAPDVELIDLERPYLGDRPTTSR